MGHQECSPWVISREGEGDLWGAAWGWPGDYRSYGQIQCQPMGVV